MKILVVLLVVICCLSLLVVSCSTQVSDFTIQLSGTQNLAYGGSILIVNAKGQSISYSVEGYLPNEYYLTGQTISCVFQKMSASGSLTVTILNNGVPVASQTTYAQYGVVSLATQ